MSEDGSDAGEAYREGAATGARIEGGAADCPYLPPDRARRDAWMRGFASTRPASSPASDPARAARDIGDDERPGEPQHLQG